MPQHINFTEHLIMAGFDYAYGISAVDLTGNGRLDIVATAERGSNELRWWRNDGPA